MTIKFDVSKKVEDELASSGQTPAAAAKEAVMVELYRQGRLSHGELAENLGCARSEVDALLKKHNVTEDLLTSQELAAQVSGLRKLAG